MCKSDKNTYVSIHDACIYVTRVIIRSFNGRHRINVVLGTEFAKGEIVYVNACCCDTYEYDYRTVNAITSRLRALHDSHVIFTTFQFDRVCFITRLFGLLFHQCCLFITIVVVRLCACVTVNESVFGRRDLLIIPSCNKNARLPTYRASL